LLRDLGALRPHLAFDLRNAFIDPGEIGRRGAVAARRGFHIADGGRQLLALRTRCLELGTQRRDGFFQGLGARGSRRIGYGLADLRLQSGDTGGETVDRSTELRGRRRGRGLNRGPAQHPADADHQRSCDSAGDRRHDPG
jgi:hypothetical protein